MKKIIALLLALSLLLCMSATAFAAEGDNGSSDPATAVESVSETGVESTIEEGNVPAEKPAETETTDPAEKSIEAEISDPAAESGTPETTEPTDESTASEGDASIGDSEASEEPADNEADSNMQPASNAEPVSDDEMLSDPPPASNATYSVTITWKGLVFTYHEASKGTWNPSHEGGPAWENPTEAGWTSSDSSNNDCGTFTIKNDSSKALKVTFTFEAESQFSANVGLKIAETEETLKSDNVTVLTGGDNFQIRQIGTSETKTLYVLPAIRPEMFTNEAFTGADKVNGVKLGTITIKLASAWFDPESPQGPEIFG